MDTCICLELKTPTTEALQLAHGEASLLLIESLMLLLLDRHVLSAEDLVKAVELAISTKRQMIEHGTQPRVASLALGTLHTIANSLAASKLCRAEAASPSAILGATLPAVS
jgi:hypothetical protein